MAFDISRARAALRRLRDFAPAERPARAAQEDAQSAAVPEDAGDRRASEPGASDPGAPAHNGDAPSAPKAGGPAPFPEPLPAWGGPWRRRWFRVGFVVLCLGLYAAAAVAFALAAKGAGHYPDGSDTMFYVYRGDFLYRQIAGHGNWYPLLDPQWYNGVQTFRYWSPMPEYLLAGTQALMGGDPFSGYVLFLGLLCFATMAPWLWLGLRFRRPALGAALGPIWFFAPNNLFMLFGEGVVARSLAMCAVPVFVAFVHDWLARGRRRSLAPVMAAFAFVTMCHVGWAGMLLLATLLFLAFYAAVNRRRSRGGAALVLGACLCAFLACGLWVFASLRGGITSLDSSEVMKNFFQPLSVTLTPVSGAGEGGLLNRWLDPALNQSPYFGAAAFVVCLAGTLLAPRRTAPGFACALAIVLLTSPVAYPVLKLLPGSQYLWMLRFLSIALAYLFVSLFFWRELRRWIEVALVGALAAECAAASVMFWMPAPSATPRERFDAVRQEALVERGEAITTQRFSMVEPFGSVADAVYVMAGYGPDAKPTSYGQGVQSAVTYSNIVAVNEAAEKGDYRYLFDRMLELGNDTVAVPLRNLEKTDGYSRAALDAAAKARGYEPVETAGGIALYHLAGAPATFGLVSSYPALGIGRSASSIALGFPAVKVAGSWNIDDYTAEELSRYETVFLSGFTYTSKSRAEELVREVAASGTRVVVMADGMPADEHTGARGFLGVDAETVNLENGYPLLRTVDGDLVTDLFPAGYTRWKTVYLNGLDDVWGTVDAEGRSLPFYGTKGKNVVFVGLNLPFFYSLTRDGAVGELLGRAIDLSPERLPERRVVPLGVSWENRAIKVESPADDVDTTLAYHDIFSSDRPIRDDDNLLHVDKGTTVVRMSYPYFWPGLLTSLAGAAGAVALLAVGKRSTT